MKTKAAALELWNEDAYRESQDIHTPRYWILLAEVEVQMLLDGVVPTKVIKRLKVLEREVLEVPK